MSHVRSGSYIPQEKAAPACLALRLFAKVKHKTRARCTAIKKILFWQEWIKTLLERLIDQVRIDYIDRGKPHAEPLPEALDHWLTWCERYEVIRKECE